MTKRMLIDARYPEETRVVVLDGERVDEFDYESTARRTLKGNIYLGKITRVEPSLQAAFVEYGGNRHGFLPFNDIHPDYYRIPISDREALIAEQADEELRGEANGHAANGDDNGNDSDNDHDNGETEAEENGTAEPIETVGGDAAEETPRAPRTRSRRSYKIQEVIKRRQIILVQVTKEERGNKGAALTSYISLAGRYCVLMPNAIRGGGISRKITNVKDRKRLKDVIGSLDLPAGMGVILRTAGMERTKTEIKRDYDFLVRVWDEIRERTLSSRAPALIYEEANLIKRTIRDVYSRDIGEVIVEGEAAYRTAKDFMRALMPSHAKRVQLYKDRSIPLFPSFQVESQLDALHAHTVRLRSGGYVVINTTEALVAIDVNSGRATRERHIEETALKTNLEAADEIARQLRLRDLAGIIVIDFIDMEDRRNNNAVERRLKEALKHDRARIQMGRISQLGLLELSRQRLRPSLFETSMTACPVCQGHGSIRSVDSTSLYVIRALEEAAVRHSNSEIAVYVPTPVALYLLNHKRDALVDIEKRQSMRVFVERDDELLSPAFRIERLKSLTPAEEPGPAEVERLQPEADEEEAEPDVAVEQPRRQAANADTEEERERQKRRRRGRRGGRRRGRNGAGDDAATPETAVHAGHPTSAPGGAAAEADSGAPEGAAVESVEAVPETSFVPETPEPEPPAPEASTSEGNASGAAAAAESEAGETRRRRPRRRKRTEAPTSEPAEEPAEAGVEEAASADRAAASGAAAQPEPAVADEDAVPWPSMPSPEAVPGEDAVPDTGWHTPPAAVDFEPAERGNGAEPDVEDAQPESAVEMGIAQPVDRPPPDSDRPRRRGWWQRNPA